MHVPAKLAGLAAGATLWTTAATAAPTTYEAFDRSIAATKQAMMADPAHALASANMAVAVARGLPPSTRTSVAISTAEWLHAEALIGMNRLGEAAPIIERTLREVDRIAPRSKLHGDLLRSHGAVAAAKGQVLQALRDYQHAYAAFRAVGVARSQAIALQDIGAIYWDAGDYARTLDYYQQSAEAFSGDPTLSLTMHNNRAQVFFKEKRYREAAIEFRAALKDAIKLDSPLLQVRILTYLARSESDAGRLASAETAIVRAMSLARGGEAAGWQPFVYGVAARIAFARGDLPRARMLIGRTFAGADFDHTEMEYRDHHQLAARIYEAAGDNRVALAHLKAFQRLDSEAQALTASAASQLMGANFDFANQKLKISQLKESQLQSAVQLERQRGRLSSLMLAAVAIIASLLAVGFVSLRRSRNATRAANTVLSEVNTQLESALKAKTEFLATTSHEIRTPLNGILGMTQVLLADARLGGEVRDRLEVVQGAGETMKALVDDILDVAKIESGRLTVCEEETDLRRILVDVGRLWQGQAEAKGLALTVDVDAAPDHLVTDGARVRQIVFNLMANALKFTAAGGVALRAATEADEAGGEQVRVMVSDDGIGIATDQHEAIFESFRQADTSTTRQFGGTGLGLAICRNLARALGGDVTVESALGEGSTFTFRLPVKLVAAAEVADERASPSIADQSFLIVGTDAVAVAMTRMAVASEGARTGAAADLAAAVAALGRGDVSHVVVDISGEEEATAIVAMLRSFVSAAEAVSARVTLLAEPAGAATVAQLMMVGADQIVVKPVDSDDLVTALASLYGSNPETLVAPNLLRQAA